MTTENSHAQAHQAIGAFFCAFSELERELGEAIKVILHVQKHEWSDNIVAALGDVARKINFVSSAIEVAKHLDGSEASVEWKKGATKTVNRMFTFNDDRRLLAHSHLQPDSHGSVKITQLRLDGGKLKLREETWDLEKLHSKTEGMIERLATLRSLKDELSTFTYAISALEGAGTLLTSGSTNRPMAL
jgi:hypothetical protein